jgi:hypothetical protein
MLNKRLNLPLIKQLQLKMRIHLRAEIIPPIAPRSRRNSSPVLIVSIQKAVNFLNQRRTGCIFRLGEG